MSKKAYIKTFGCQMNQYDSEKITAILAAANYELTQQFNLADLILLNTCSIREKAQEKVFSELGRYRLLKAQNPALLIAIGGCVASQEGFAMLQRAPYIDIIFGPQTLHRLIALINARVLTGKPQVDISFPEIEKFDNLPTTTSSSVTALVSIMEGCSKYCSYCVVPYTRGEEISRPLASVMQEIETVVAAGARDINLLGQNVNAYRGEMSDGAIADFALLLEFVHNIPLVQRIRFTTSHPVEMTQRIIDCYGKLPKLVSYLHLPVQSGSDKVLSAMKRGYTVLEYKSIIRKIRALRKEISFSSDFIVGFPGETAADFQQTLDLMDAVKFDSSFSFVYSPRPGTPAAAIIDDTPQMLKLARLAQLQSHNRTATKEISDNMLGSMQHILLEDVAKHYPDYLVGRSDNYKLVRVKCNAARLGYMLPVRITDVSNPYLLVGEHIYE